MSFVCKWLGLYLCIKEPPSVECTLADKCNVLVVLKDEKKRESTGGMSFCVTLKPALADSPSVVKNGTPTRTISEEAIAKKLKDAQERREALEASKVQSSSKYKERCQEVNQRLQELNDSFSRATEKKLVEKMDMASELKTIRISALQERLKDHAARVDEVHQRFEQTKVAELKEKIERKQESAIEKREAKLNSIRDRLYKHTQHINEVIEASSKFSKDTEEKLIQKLEASQALREEQLAKLIDRLKDHERRCEKVRQNKLNQSMSAESIGNDSLSGDTGCSDSMSELDVTAEN